MSLKIDGNKAVGYVAVYNSPSKQMVRADGQKFIEVIQPGAFTSTLSDGHNIMALASHEQDDVLGSTAAKTLILREDATGLYAEIELPDTTAGRDLRALLARGEPYGGSFRASVEDWNWGQGAEPGVLLCAVRSLSLKEVTVTPFPAYEETSVVLRSTRHPEIPKTVQDSTELERLHHRLRVMKL